MTRTDPTPAPARATRAARFNRQARALADAEALGIDLRDPFATLSPDAESDLDSLIYGRPFAFLI